MELDYENYKMIDHEFPKFRNQFKGEEFINTRQTHPKFGARMTEDIQVLITHFRVAAARSWFDHKYPIAYDSSEKKNNHNKASRDYINTAATIGDNQQTILQKQAKARGRR